MLTDLRVFPSDGSGDLRVVLESSSRYTSDRLSFLKLAISEPEKTGALSFPSFSFDNDFALGEENIILQVNSFE